jgi:hypothetical protein
VYKDFRSVVLQILGMHDHGSGGPAVSANITVAPVLEKVAESMPYKAPAKGFPPVIWVIGEYFMQDVLQHSRRKMKWGYLLNIESLQTDTGGLY